MFIMDTDVLSIIQRREQPASSRLMQRMNEWSISDFHITVISVHEQMMGANAYIKRTRNARAIAFGYQLIQQAISDYQRFTALPYDERDALRFDELRKQGVRIGTMDLRIACIALTSDFTVLTRNTVDFEKVPGLKFEDWTTR